MYTLFKNKTKYTKKVYDDYCKSHTQRHWLPYIIYTLVIILVISTCLIYQIKNNNYMLISVLLISLILFVGWRYFYPRYTRQKTLTSPVIKKEITYIFTFFEKTFEISSKEDPNDILCVKYGQLYKVFNSTKYIYLYIDKTHSFILDKKCFEIGNSEGFISFIKKKCWYKYKTYSKK